MRSHRLARHIGRGVAGKREPPRAHDLGFVAQGRQLAHDDGFEPERAGGDELSAALRAYKRHGGLPVHHSLYLVMPPPRLTRSSTIAPHLGQ